MDFSKVKLIGVDIKGKSELNEKYNAVITLAWACEGIGFGEYVIFQTSDGKWYADSETMDSEDDHSLLEHLLNYLSQQIQVY